MADAPDGEKAYGSRGCIVCGRENPAGLRVTYHAAAGRSRAEVTPPARFQGFDGTLHGGIVSALLDDAMWYAAYSAGMFTMTAELTVRFKKPVPVERPLRLEGRLLARRGRLAEMAAELRDAAGEVLAEARAKFLAVPEDMRLRLGAATAIEGRPAAGANPASAP